MSPDEAAERFTVLFGTTFHQVSAYVRRRVSPEAAQDVVSEVFVVAWTHLARIPAEPLPWLYKVAWHAVGNHRRALGRRADLSVHVSAERLTDPVGRDPAEQVVGAETARQALDTLSATDREAVQLICWEGLSLAQAADVLSCSVGTLKVRLHRARRRLAAALAEAPFPTVTTDTVCSEGTHS